MEPRVLLDADPVIAGLTYLEGDLGQDTTPDYFEVTFEGGSATTQMTQFVINGDQDLSGGLSDGDMFFDVSSGQPGTGGYHGFQFHAGGSIGVSADDVLGVDVSSDGLIMTVNVRNFEAGDRLAFTVDVDEVERHRTDKIASGVEFEGSYFNATFVDSHYDFSELDVTTTIPLENGVQQTQSQGIFFDEYDQLFDEASQIAGTTLNLAADNETGHADRTAGAIDAYELTPKPIEISGNVYHDENLNCEKDVDEEGIEGVNITLQQFNAATGKYETVATTQTDANGHYEFGKNLGLMPGRYRLIETQPEGYLDVAASAGTVEGVQEGSVRNDASGNQNILTDIDIPLGGNVAENYDFKEVRPATLQGNVYHDRDNDGVMDPGEEGIANVLIQITRVGAKDPNIVDPFANFDVINVRTDANGHYEVTGLPPGVYEVVEVNNYPAGQNPLAGFVDGKDTLGRVGQVQTGVKANDRFTEIELCADDDGVEYNFGEIKPASISGFVSITTPEGDCLDPTDPNHRGIAGIEISLFDVSGNLVATTRTNAEGFYEFENLGPGVYSVVEGETPGFFDAGDTVGKVDGVTTGLNPVNDRFVGITLESGQQGTMYNFCESEPGWIEGTVFADTNGNCILETGNGDYALEGVLVQLLDSDGNVIDEMRTDGQGHYIFQGLARGTYSVREFTPDGMLDGGELVGTVNGKSTGSTSINDRIDGISIGFGEHGLNYDFCEHIPAEISGHVWHDEDNDGKMESGEQRISGIDIFLYDDNNNLVATTTTNGNGFYQFKNLIGGEYYIVEGETPTYVDGKDSLGYIDGVRHGVKQNDRFVNIEIQGGQKGTQYNFGEIRLASIQGFVHTDTNGNCVLDSTGGERPLEGVTIQLLDTGGNVLQETQTNADGHYQFNGLLPGTYSVQQIQPGNLFSVGQRVGTVVGQSGDGPGDSSAANVISDIRITSGQNLVEYNFCEDEPAEIHGRVWEDGPIFKTDNGVLPSNYRNLRDGVYADGLDTPISGVRMTLWFYIDPDTSAIAPRPVTLADVMPEFYQHMGTSDPSAAIWVDTGADGAYSFEGLKAGNYIVLESQPDGYSDANDVVGSTSGFTFNSVVEANLAPNAILQRFSTSQIMDTVANIRVNSGGVSVENNFTEVRVEPDGDTPFTPEDPERPGNPVPPRPPLGPGLGLAGALNVSPTTYIGSRGIIVDPASIPYTWHLSVVNAGNPRGGELEGVSPTWQQAAFLTESDWTRFDMAAGQWTYSVSDNQGNFDVLTDSDFYGMPDGIPVVGDFNGDGVDEIAVFLDGYWMIDINGSGKWEDTDLMARLGNADDLPVVGDWDGDGKDDIGIYGPIWEGDPAAIDREPGLPDPDNVAITRPKNIPPHVVEATNGGRIMQLSSFGRSRIDVIDHVFGYGDAETTPVTGDWNGDGIRTIGMFRGGVWQIDSNGDGRFEQNDEQFTFGRAGDVPVVGDFNGDGVEEVAIYRDGRWIIDINGNHEIDAADKVFELGATGDIPVVGDFNGDGVDEPAIYQSHSVQADRGLN